MPGAGISGSSGWDAREGPDTIMSSVAGRDGSLRLACQKKFFLRDRRRDVLGLPVDIAGLGDEAEPGRLNFSRRPPNSSVLLLTSRTAPAVAGRGVALPCSRVVSSTGRAILAKTGLAAPMLIIEERLPDTECPRTVDMELSVSDDIVDKGRMYSMRSEKPTRTRGAGLRGEESDSSRNRPESSAGPKRSED
jgi:hypothetical protein